MSYKLSGRVVLITGASSGIGRACAVAYHNADCRIVAVARSQDKLAALATELDSDRVLTVSADITEADARAAAVKAAVDRFGRIDVLVNNAGWASFSSVARLPVEHLDRMLALNLKAPIALTQAVLPEMIARGSGQIVNIASVVGTQAIPRMAVYSATKAALWSVSTGLRMELRGTGVDVLLIAPGSTNTPFFDTAATVDASATRLSHTQYTPERVARAVVKSSRRRRREVTLTAEGIAITVIRRFSHTLADTIMYQVGKRSMPKIEPSQPAEN